VALFIQCLLKKKKQREFGDLEATSKSDRSVLKPVLKLVILLALVIIFS
jgi:hypothetical protein